MQGKLSTKSKVIYTIRPRSQVFRRKIKRERASTPQRWSRRIRSLPPIPINVLAPHRKTRRKSTTIYKREKIVVARSEKGSEKRRMSRGLKEKKHRVYVNKNNLDHKLDTVEVVRIVPVVVFVKNPSKANLKCIPKEIRVHINGRSTCKMFAQTLDTSIRRKIKKEHTDLERRYSRRIKAIPPNSFCAVGTRRRHAIKKRSMV